MKLYRCKRFYYDEFEGQNIYCPGQLCAFEDDDKFPHFEHYFEEIELSKYEVVNSFIEATHGKKVRNTSGT